MARTSAGLLPYRRGVHGELLVLVAQLGGPLWARRPRAWTVVKGEYDAGGRADNGDDEGEPALAAAEREFREEMGVDAPPGDRVDLGEVRQSGGKVVRVWAVEAPAELAFVASETFEMEWPPRSGRRQSFPEVATAEWVDLATARERMVAAQTAFLDRLEDAMRR